MKTFSKIKKNKWVVLGICISMIMAFLFTSLYGVFARDAGKYTNNPLESKEQLTYLYHNAYVLYKDLYNTKNHTNAGYKEIYLKPAKGYEWLLENETAEMPVDEFYARLYDMDSIPPMIFWWRILKL